MAGQPFIHVGLHKTATTFLQRAVFPGLDLNYIPRDHPGIAPALRRICVQDILVFDAEATRDEVLPLLSGRKNLISTENLSGSPLFGYVNRDAILRKLHRTFPYARIIIGIRAQCDIIWSLYRHYIKRGGLKRLEELLVPLGGYDRLDLETFKYSFYLRRIEDLFGRDNVHICVFEDLVLDQSGYLDKLLAFLGTGLGQEVNPERANVGIPDQAVATRRVLNRLFMSPRRSNGFLPPPPLLWAVVNSVLGSIPLQLCSTELELLKPLREYYREDNHLVDKRYALGLTTDPYKRERWF